MSPNFWDRNNLALVPLLKINSLLPELRNEIVVVSKVLLWHWLEGVWGNGIESRGPYFWSTLWWRKWTLPKKGWRQAPSSLPVSQCHWWLLCRSVCGWWALFKSDFANALTFSLLFSSRRPEVSLVSMSLVEVWRLVPTTINRLIFSHPPLVLKGMLCISSVS